MSKVIPLGQGRVPTWLLFSFHCTLLPLIEKRKIEMPKAGRHSGPRK